MLTTIEGTYREGRIHLKESPAGIREARVLVTFIEERPEGGSSGLRGLSPQERATRLAALQATWAGKLSPSDTFARAKAEEIEMEERPRSEERE